MTYNMQYNVNTCRFEYDQYRCRVFFSSEYFLFAVIQCGGVRDQLCAYYLFPLLHGFGGSDSSHQACVVS